MGVEVAVDVFVEHEHVEKYKAVIQDVIHNHCDPDEVENGVCFSYGYISYSRMEDAINAMQIEQVPCSFYVSNSSDPSIEDFTSEIKEVDGEWIADETTNSGKREKEALLAVLEKIESGESPEQLKAYLEEKIKMIC